MAARKKHQIEDAKQAAKRVSQYVQMSDIRLLGSLCFNHVEPGSQLPIYAGQKIDIKAGVGSGKDGFAAVADLGISVGYEPEHEYVEESTDAPVIVSATFLLLYSIESDGLSQKDIESFVSATAIQHVWPYWREFVQSMTTRMGFPAMTLPLLKRRADGGDADGGDAESLPIKKKAKRKTSSKK